MEMTTDPMRETLPSLVGVQDEPSLASRLDKNSVRARKYLSSTRIGSSSSSFMSRAQAQIFVFESS
ncbi:UNVERIFIED_CONTAM: hypothetical protein Slati_2543300 [Sesamum latifolium]|uniref:Uncharacterized protein n=1 Tax=Sesamum latifolium TaxID=2727402 RepID=A0AAW2WGH6_9LAMI